MKAKAIPAGSWLPAVETPASNPAVLSPRESDEQTGELSLSESLRGVAEAQNLDINALLSDPQGVKHAFQFAERVAEGLREQARGYRKRLRQALACAYGLLLIARLNPTAFEQHIDPPLKQQPPRRTPFRDDVDKVVALMFGDNAIASSLTKYRRVLRDLLSKDTDFAQVEKLLDEGLEITKSDRETSQGRMVRTRQRMTELLNRLETNSRVEVGANNGLMSLMEGSPSHDNAYVMLVKREGSRLVVCGVTPDESALLAAAASIIQNEEKKIPAPVTIVMKNFGRMKYRRHEKCHPAMAAWVRSFEAATGSKVLTLDIVKGERGHVSLPALPATMFREIMNGVRLLLDGTGTVERAHLTVEALNGAMSAPTPRFSLVLCPEMPSEEEEEDAYDVDRHVVERSIQLRFFDDGIAYCEPALDRQPQVKPEAWWLWGVKALTLEIERRATHQTPVDREA